MKGLPFLGVFSLAHPFSHPSRARVDPTEVLPCMMQVSLLQHPVTLCVIPTPRPICAIKKKHRIYMCKCSHVWGYVYHVPASAHRGRGASDSQELSLQVVMSSLTWLLGTESRPFAGAVRTINHGAIYSARSISALEISLSFFQSLYFLLLLLAIKFSNILSTRLNSTLAAQRPWCSNRYESRLCHLDL